MTLDQLPPGNGAVIAAVNCNEQALRKRFLDMGLIPGTRVAMVKAAPLGDPLELRIRGYELTIRKADAAKISLSRFRASSGQRIPPSAAVSSLIEEAGTRSSGGSRRGPSPGQPIRLALVGNQNCGKTTLFNQLTGTNQHVGNFPGVTVERKDGVVRGHSGVTITDLPGIYSLSPYSGEEAVTRDFLLDQRPDGIINILDATSLERGLSLTMQLMGLGIPMILALNMMDEVRSGGGSIRISRMEQILGLPVIPISAAKNEGIDGLIERCIHTVRQGETPAPLDLRSTDRKSRSVQRCIHALTRLIAGRAQQEHIPVGFAAAGLMEGDPFLRETLHLAPEETAAAERIITQMEAERGLDRAAALADMRFRLITALCAETILWPRESREHIRSRRLDRVLTGKYTALPAFAGIMVLVFCLTFGLFGPFFSEALALGIGWFTALCGRGLAVWDVHPVVQSLVIDGIFTGVGSVLSFLPIIVVLFFFLSILEDSLLALAGGWIAPILRPLGLGDWRIAAALITGFTAKESVVSTITVLLGGSAAAITGLLSPLSAMSFLVFSLLYTPCAAAIAAVRRELGRSWALMVVASQCAVAWLAAFGVHWAGGLF